MADISDPSAGLDNPSPGDDLNGNDSRGIKRPRNSMAADDDDDDDEKGGRERRKIEIKFISDKSRRHITFSKRKAGIMKKVRPQRHRHNSSDADSNLAGIRVICPHWYTSPTPGRLRDWPCLHLHHTQAPATRDQGRGQELDSGQHIPPRQTHAYTNTSNRPASMLRNPPVPRMEWTPPTTLPHLTTFPPCHKPKLV
jgi:hypothetical protein